MVLARNGLVVVARRNRRLVLAPATTGPARPRRRPAALLRRNSGPTFIKFGQVIASIARPVPPLPRRRVPPAARRRTRRAGGAHPAHDRARAWRADRRGVRGLRRRARSRRRRVAQVHKAQLLDGTDRRREGPPAAAARSGPSATCGCCACWPSCSSRMGALGETLNPVAIVDDFALTLRAELDFRDEAAAMVEIAANLRALGVDDACVVPEPIDGMVTERVLVMTFIEGTPVDDRSQPATGRRPRGPRARRRAGVGRRRARPRSVPRRRARRQPVRHTGRQGRVPRLRHHGPARRARPQRCCGGRCPRC